MIQKIIKFYSYYRIIILQLLSYVPSPHVIVYISFIIQITMLATVILLVLENKTSNHNSIQLGADTKRNIIEAILNQQHHSIAIVLYSFFLLDHSFCYQIFLYIYMYLHFIITPYSQLLYFSADILNIIP